MRFEKLNFNISQVWLSSDFHFYHRNMARGTSIWKNGFRDFDDEEIMTNFIIDEINSNVKEDDLLIHLGDWSFGGDDKIALTRNKINCKNVINIIGNHDHHFLKKEIQDLFYKVEYQGNYQIEDVKIVCNHYPTINYFGEDKGAKQFHGHYHGKSPEIFNGISYDVGLDNNNLKLVKL